jgi:LysR family transcriptional regulator, glycine cleavage system transcriptional activator
MEVSLGGVVIGCGAVGRSKGKTAVLLAGAVGLKHQSITQAAREIHLGQSAASRKLKQLEVDLNTKLFKKQGRGIETTKAGRAFLNEVAPVLAQLEAMRQKYTNHGSSREPRNFGQPRDMAP